jgi:tetratricopeptide (TPR) repeat protein
VKSNYNITQEQLEQIESYFNDSLTDEKRIQFENRMKNDPQFELMVNDMRELLLGIESASLRDQLDDFHDDMVPVHSLNSTTEERSHKVKSAGFRIFRMVAAAAIIVSLGVFWFASQRSPSGKLFAKHFSPDPGLPTTMGTTSNFDFYDAMVNYKQGDYSTAIKKWQTQLRTKPNNDTLQYFLGVAQLANGNEHKAIEYLKELSENNNNSFELETAYYLGLGYLKAGNAAEAKKYLTFSKTESGDQILSELND